MVHILKVKAGTYLYLMSCYSSVLIVDLGGFFFLFFFGWGMGLFLSIFLSIIISNFCPFIFSLIEWVVYETVFFWRNRL